MSFTASFASVIGMHDSTHWSQSFFAHEFAIAAEVTGEQATVTGTRFFRELQNQEWPAIKTLTDFKKLLAAHIPEGAAYIAFLICGTHIFVVGKLSGMIYIKRGEKLALLLSGDGTLSGKIEKDDIFLLTTEHLGTIAKTHLRTLFALSTPRAIAEQLTLELHREDPIPVAAALVIKCDSYTERKISPLIGLLTWFKTRAKKITLQKKPSSPIIIGICLGVLLLISIIFGVSKKKMDREQTEWQSVLADVTHKYDEGTALVDLNPARSRELLNEAKTLLEKTQFTNSQIKKQQAEEMHKVNDGIAVSLKSYTVTLTPFFELDLIKSGGTGTHVGLFEDTAVITDTANKSLYTLTLSTKSSRVIGGDDSVKNSRAVAIYGENIYVAGDEIKKVVNGALQTVIPHDTEWGTLISAAVFNDNIYALDPAKNQIWKYVNSNGAFGQKQNYLLPDTTLDIGGGTDIAVDGTVWVSAKNQVIHFVQGSKEGWNIKGLDQPLGNELQIFTDEATKNMYIFDRTNKRVVVSDKEGAYLSQYKWTSDTLVTDFVVSETLKKILLLSRGTIYGIDLK